MGLTLTSRAPTSPIDAYTFKSSYAAADFRSVAAATGTVPTIYSLTVNDAARTAGALKGMSINIEPLAGYDCYGITGAEICMYASTGTVSGSMVGLFVECQGLSTAITGDWNALVVYSAPGANPSGTAHCVRIESNPSTVTFQDSFINFVGNPNFTFYHSAQGTAGLGSGDKTGTAAGWMNVNMGGATRYIQLYS